MAKFRTGSAREAVVWMRRIVRMHPGILLVLLMCLIVGAALSPSVALGGTRGTLLATTVQPDPIYIEIASGDTDTVAVRAAGAVNLHAFQITLSFDPSLLQVVDADPVLPGVQVVSGTIPSLTDWQALQNVADNVAGTIQFVASLTVPGAFFDGSDTLLVIPFWGIAGGTSSLTIDEVIFSDSQGLGLAVTPSDGTVVVTGGTVPTVPPTATATASPVPTPVPTNSARVDMSPATRDVALGMTTTVDINIVNAINLYGADVRLAFDPSIVRVVDSDAGSTGIQVGVGSFPYADFVPLNMSYNVTGTVEFALTQIPPRPAITGSGVMGTLIFEGLAGGISPITITSAILSDPDGVEILSTTNDGQIQVLTWGIIVGHVTYQGRSTPPSADWVSPISVTLYAHGEVSPAYGFAAVTDEMGTFTVTNILTDTYDVKVRDLHSLWNVRSNVAVGLGIVALDMGTLVEGDSDLNGLIDVVDFSILSSSFGTTDPDPLFDRRADYNNSNDIDILDFSLLASNYGRSGEVLLTVAGSAQDVGGDSEGRLPFVPPDRASGDRAVPSARERPAPLIY